jgi:hypothetical protein
MAKSSPKQNFADEAPAPAAADSKIEVGLESVAIIVAEVAPGVRRYITGVTDDGRVLAGDTREGAEISPYKAKAIIHKVRESFPTAEIQLILA